MSARTLLSLVLACGALLGACATSKVNIQQAEGHYKNAVYHLAQPGGPFDERNRRNAFPEVERAIALNPDRFNYHQALGDLLLLENDLVLAERSFAKAANLAPTRPEPLVGLGNLYLKQNRPKDAVRSYRMALESRSYPSPEIIYFNLGKAYFMDGDFPRALEMLQRAAQMLPTYAEVHFQIGLTLLEMGLVPGAEQSFKRVIEVAPTSSQAHFQLGLIQMKDRRFDEARTSFQAVVGIETSGELRDQAQRYLSVLR